MGGTAPAVLNAANEVAVEAFLNGEIPFLEIASVIRATLAGHEVKSLEHIDEVLRADLWARKQARQVAVKIAGGGQAC
jgi:1-deoxy-D-xylulose-5-phosphate reductoisomerase